MTDDERRNTAQALLQQRRLAKAALEAAQKKRAVAWEQPNSTEKAAELAALDARITELTSQVDAVDAKLAGLIPNQAFGRHERVTFANFN